MARRATTWTHSTRTLKAIRRSTPRSLPRPRARTHARTHAPARTHARSHTHTPHTHAHTPTQVEGWHASALALFGVHGADTIGGTATTWDKYAPHASCVVVHVHSYAVRSGRGPASALACVHGIAHGLISWIHGMVSHTGWCSRLLVASAATCAFPAWMTATCTSSSARQSLQRYTLPVDHYLLSALSSAMPR